VKGVFQMANFNPVTPELVEELKRVMSDKQVKTDEDYLTAYQTDEEGNSHYFSKPEVVVFPESTEQVVEIVKLANKYLVPITPRSAGSGVACGAIPVYHGIVVELERMNKILKLDADNMYAVCQTGVLTGDLQREAAKHNLLYAGDPSSADSSMIGGNVANNAGGNKAVKYGTTRHQVYSLKVVTPTGDVLDAGARLKKSSTGLCLEQLFAGSEGALGIITEVTVKLRPMPPYSFNMVCVFKTDNEAFALPNKILKAGVDPTSIEFMDNEALKITCKFLDMPMPNVEDGCNYVIVTVESFSQDDLDRKMELLCDLAEENGSVTEFEADKRIWKLRKQFAEAARDIDKMFQTEDFVVPLDKIPEMTAQIPELREKYDLYCVTVAHIGDGNIHVLPLNKKGLSPEEWFEKIKAFHADLFPRVYALGGKMSGEHGIGYKKLEEFAKCTPAAELAVTKAIKKALDPNNIMNPGKLVDMTGDFVK
jgi:glycolate oxidase